MTQSTDTSHKRLQPWHRLSWLLFLPLLQGCGVLPTDHELADGPTLDLYDFFDGETRAWGIVQDWRGRVIRQFAADIRGSIVDGQLVLDESFDYADGERAFRQWRIQQRDNAQYRGTASDIEGEALGQVIGNAFAWQYEMDLESGGRTYRVRFDDRMWQIDGDTLINRALIKKFGITVAAVTLFMQKAPERS